MPREKHRSFSSHLKTSSAVPKRILLQGCPSLRQPFVVPTPRGDDGPRCLEQNMQKNTSRRRKNRASSGQSSLPSRCWSPGNRNPASVGRGDTPSTAPLAGMGRGLVSNEKGWGTHRHARRMEVYHRSAGGQGRWVLAEQAGTAAKNYRADTSTGQEQDREPRAQALAALHAASPVTFPCLCPTS